MAIRLTLEQFISKAISVHGNKFDYNKVHYVNCDTKVIVVCKTHGEFLVSPDNHLRGRGCPKCKAEGVGKRFSVTHDQFIENAIKVHGDKYDYSKTVYIKSKEQVEILCKRHGAFLQKPDKHLAGKGCPKCKAEGARLRELCTTDEFIEKSIATHGDKYTYELAEYVDCFTHVKITCSKHGVFLQKPYVHVMGRGCTECGESGYRNSLSGYFYILESDDGTTKVGITNNKVENRTKRINRSSKKCFTKHLELFFDDGSVPRKIETQVLQHLRSKYKSPVEKFDGSTECFLEVNVREVYQIIDNLLFP